MDPFEDEFRKTRIAYEKTASRSSGLVCTTGIFEGCPGVKLHKHSWGSNTQVGIFFSVWVDKDSVRTRRVHYNIHALKVRQLKFYIITSRDFAKAFRAEFKTVADSWPNVRTDYGPLNLMQGWIPLQPEAFERDVLSLLARFETVSPIIDRLLEERLSPYRRAAQ